LDSGLLGNARGKFGGGIGIGGVPGGGAIGAGAIGAGGKLAGGAAMLGGNENPSGTGPACIHAVCATGELNWSTRLGEPIGCKRVCGLSIDCAGSVESDRRTKIEIETIEMMPRFMGILHVRERVPSIIRLTINH
jgi:hypothetical protein